MFKQILHLRMSLSLRAEFQLVRLPTLLLIKPNLSVIPHNLSLKLRNNNANKLMKVLVNRKFRRHNLKLFRTSQSNKRLRKIVRAKQLSHKLLSLTQLTLKATNRVQDLLFHQKIKDRVWPKLTQDQM